MSTLIQSEPDVAVKSRMELADRWLMLLAVALAGYVLLGKGFAYIGAPPLFIGEIIVASGMTCLLVLRRWRLVLKLPTLSWLVLFMVWGAVVTLPYLSRFGIDSLRDAVLWGYGTVAIVVAAMVLSRPRRLGDLIQTYRRFVPWLLVLLPAFWVVDQLWNRWLPTWPWAPDVRVILLKGGDCLVHLTGVLAFWVSGLAGRVPAWQVALFAMTAIAVGTSNRGGLLTLLVVGTLCFMLRPRSGAMRSLIIGAAAVFMVAAASNIDIQVPGESRTMSTWQLMENVTSITTRAGEGDLQGTKQWRLSWWRDIADYTVFGEYFWAGKGFGINLANDDGYQVNEDESLRSPHSAHMTVLARMGVPGVLLWILLLASWAWTLGRAYLLSRSRGDRTWNGIFLFLFAYGLACLLNSSFDVFLEGPMGGIWFWTLVGMGIAAAWCYRHAPDALGERCRDGAKVGDRRIEP